MQSFKDGVQRCFGIALDIGVVDAQDHGSAVVAGVQPIKDESTGATDVEISGRRGSEANSH